jgi:hypothetical protein
MREEKHMAKRDCMCVWIEVNQYIVCCKILVYTLKKQRCFPFYLCRKFLYLNLCLFEEKQE